MIWPVEPTDGTLLAEALSLSDSGQLEQARRKALRASAPPARLRERGIAVPVVHGQDRLGLNIANTPLGFSSATHTCRS